ncbi:glycosyltransferase [Candidatus Poribacteria bacterium]|nr:glycosyltransferase [Candidatus Poribacteria bacterium]
MHKAKIDLHCHSKASSAGLWVLRQIGCAESYTPPESLYQLAMNRNMDFVTITDHDNINGVKEILDYDNVIIGRETTAFFPDGVKVHVVCIDINEEQNREIEEVRHNVYDLVDYLNQEDIIHFAAHPLYKVNGDLTWDHFEKLILLFKRHEVLNGGRYDRTNRITKRMLSSLTEEDIKWFADKHNLEPVGDRPWEKYFVGGSDDHGGLFVGSCHTEVMVEEMTKEALLEGIRAGRTEACGVSDGSLTLAHQIISVGYQYAMSQKGQSSEAALMLKLMLQKDGKKPNIWTRRKLKKALKRSPEKEQSPLVREVRAVVQERPELKTMFNSGTLSAEEINKHVFNLAADLWDRLIIQITEQPLLLNSFIAWGTAILGAYMASMSSVHKDLDLIHEAERFMGEAKPKKVAWFTDRYQVMDGVVRTINRFLDASKEYDCDLTVVVSDEKEDGHPEGIKAFPSITNFRIPMYKDLTLYFPSFLRLARWMEEEEFDSVVISTPGPMGFAGLLAAKVFGLPVTSIYHTDLPRYSYELTNDNMLAAVVAKLAKAFYDQADRILVPSSDYAAELEKWGIRTDKIGFLRRWVDREVFSPAKRSNNGYFGHTKGTKLLYVGRISKEKNLDLLLDVHNQLLQRNRDFTMLCIGEGPYLEELRDKTKHMGNFKLLGPMFGEQLSKAYASADIFAFPSLTDTFGNVVLEAQASGIPCVVMNQGGPKEIVIDGKSGIVATNSSMFVNSIDKLMLDKQMRLNMSKKAVDNVARFDKEDIFMGFWHTVTGHEKSDRLELDYMEPTTSLSYV